jgi:hypothetical protein
MADTPELEARSVCGRLSKKHWLRCCLGRMRGSRHADAVWVIEVWDDAEAHQASLDLEAIQKLIARARPVIAEMGDRFEMQPLGGKGFRLPPG